jgi:hypothetical protein
MMNVKRCRFFWIGGVRNAEFEHMMWGEAELGIQNFTRA